MTSPGGKSDAKIVSSAGATKVLVGGWQLRDENGRARADEVIITALPSHVLTTAGNYDVTIATASGLKSTGPDQLRVG